MATVPTNYKIKIKDLLNSSLGKVVIDSIIAKSVKVNNILTVDAANVKLDNEKGTTLQDVLNYFEENKLNRHTDDTFDGNLTIKKDLTIEGHIKSDDGLTTVEENFEATGEITDGDGNMLSDVNSAAKGWKIEYQDPQQDEPTVRAKYVLKDYKGVPKGNVIKVYKDSAITNVYLGTTEDTCNPDTGEVTKKPVHDNNEALSIVYRLDIGKYMLVNVPLGIFTKEAEFDKYRGLGIEPNGQVFVKLASDVESTNYLHFNSLGEIAADGIEARILRDLGTLISSVAGDDTMWGQYKQEEGTREGSAPNDGSRWGEYKAEKVKRDEVVNHMVLADNWTEAEDDPTQWEDPTAVESSYAYNWKTTDTPASDGKTQGNLKDLYEKTLNQDGKLSLLSRDVTLIDGVIDSGTSYDTITINNRVCAVYPIADVNHKFRVEVSNLKQGLGCSLDIWLIDNKDTIFGENRAFLFKNLTTDFIKEFYISDNYKAFAKYIAVVQQGTVPPPSEFSYTCKCTDLSAKIPVIENNVAQINYTVNEIKEDINGLTGDIDEVDKNSKRLLGFVDSGTTYSEKYKTTGRTCVFYPIEDFDKIYKIKLSNIILPSGDSITVSLRSDATPYSASFVRNIGTSITTKFAEKEISFTEDDKVRAKYIGICQEEVNSELCSFYSEVTIGASIIDKTREHEDEIKVLRAKANTIKSVVDIIDDGTTYQEKYKTTGRTCVFYPIPDVNAQYNIKVTDLIVPSSTNVVIRLTDTESPYSAAVKVNIKEYLKTGDAVSINFSVPDNHKLDAKYIAVYQDDYSLEACSFKVTLENISARLPIAEKFIEENTQDIAKIKGIIGEDKVYDTPTLNSRVVALFPITDVNAKYKYNVHDCVVPSGYTIDLYLLKSDVSVYSANILHYILQNLTGDFKGEYEIPESYKSQAKYLAIVQQGSPLPSTGFKFSASVSIVGKNIETMSEQIGINTADISNINSRLDADIIPYNDSFFDEEKFVHVKIFNPYKEAKLNQYAGQLHCHTWTNENGVKVPLNRGTNLQESVKNLWDGLKDHGIHFVSFTDYQYFNDITRPVEGCTDMLYLYGSYECATTYSDSDNTIGQHMIIMNVGETHNYQRVSPQYIAEKEQSDGAIVTLAHPLWTGTFQPLSKLDRIKHSLHYVEVFNGGDFLSGNRQEEFKDKPDFAFDRLLSNGNYIFATAVSDSHSIGWDTKDGVNYYAPVTGCIKVFADNLERVSVIDAILKGNYYCASYVSAKVNSICVENGYFKIDVGEPGAQVRFLKENYTLIDTQNTTEDNTIAQVKLSKDYKFVRAIIKLANGYEIWTQAIVMSSSTL